MGLTQELRNIEVEFQIEFEDYRKAHLRNFYSNKSVIILHILGGFLVVALTSFSIFRGITEGLSTSDILLILTLFIIFGFLFSLPSFGVINLNSHMASIQPILLKFKWTISDKGAVITKISGSNTYIWELFFKIIDLKEYF